MNKIYFFLLLALISTQVTAQTYITAESRAGISELLIDLQKYQEEDREYLFAKYPLLITSNGICVSMLGKVNEGYNDDLLPNGITSGSRVGNIVTLKVAVNRINELSDIDGVDVLELSRKIQPQIDRAVKDLRADSLHRGLGINQPYTGKDVIIGITDWGFDYSHPMFMDTALSNTRILAAWDQFRRAGSPPAGFNYGSEIVGNNALASYGSDTACLYYDYATHGSHVAGIAGGSGAGIGLRGVAFESDFLFSQFYLDAASAIDAVSWMKDFAEKEKKPLVVNMSWGLYHLGPLDGTSLLSQAFDDFAAEGVLIVTSGGNNGDVNFHIRRDFLSDTLKTVVDFYTYANNKSNGGQSISAWGSAFEAFSIGFDIYDGNRLAAASPYYNTFNSSSYIDSMLVYGTDTVYFNIAIDAAFPTNNSPHARLRIKNTNSKLKVVMKATSHKGTVHFWNVTELNNGAGNWGMPFSPFNGGLGGDTKYGIGEPAATKSVLTVAAHGSEVKLPNGTINYGPLATFSSEGPTPDERIKPDVSAPGINVLSSISSYTTASYVPSETVSFSGRTYHFSKFSGTSMASPAAAGVAALLLDIYPQLSPAQVKEIMMNTAREDPKTGVIPVSGSTEWGFGKVTATSAASKVLELTGIPSKTENFNLKIFPNPASQQVSIFLNKQVEFSVIRVSTMAGREVYSTIAKGEQITLNIQDLKRGMYLVQIQNSQGWFCGKLVKN